MKPEVLERAIKLNDSIKSIDQVTDFVSEHKKVFMMVQSGFGDNASFSYFTKEVQDFLIYEALPTIRGRLVDELDKL